MAIHFSDCGVAKVPVIFSSARMATARAFAVSAAHLLVGFSSRPRQVSLSFLHDFAHLDPVVFYISVRAEG